MSEHMDTTPPSSTFDTAEDAVSSLEDMAGAVAHLLERAPADLAAFGDRLVDLSKALADIERAVYPVDDDGSDDGQGTPPGQAIIPPRTHVTVRSESQTASMTLYHDGDENLAVALSNDGVLYMRPASPRFER